ncbi:hypothetical protein LTR66_011394 [Elasticomyces elasticus]|nr:hypothetical protein LTR66_011394 [Elasticomyces elasticus]KAK4985355.1 hypothetical protein LTR50_006032 [Elasticomyces elasticus]
MESQTGVNDITSENFDTLLKDYASHVPTTLADLEVLRWATIPETIEQRTNDGKAFLKKEEVLELVRWKLSHGTFRPTLMKLVASNSAEDIRSVTESGFTTYAASKEEHIKAITTLAKLRGIGPATASLLLASLDPATVPFFSDELFRWLKLEDGKGKGWDRKIAYTIKEYGELYQGVQRLKKRMLESHKRDVTAVDIEKVAYVLGKRAKQGVEVEVLDSQGAKSPVLKKRAIREVPSTATRTSKRMKKAE